MSGRIRVLLWMACFAALTAVGGWIRIPVIVVPATLQSFFVILSGGCLGKKGGAGSQILFLGMGLMGIPVFSMGGGPGYVLQPTFGYLLGFVPAAWTVGWLMEHMSPPQLRLKQYAAALSGTAVILSTGVVVLMLNLRWIAGSRLSLPEALWMGAVVFFPVEIIKAVAAVEMIRRIRPHLIRMGSDG